MVELLTVEELAAMVDMHPRTIRRYLREGQLKAIKVGGEWRIKREDAEVFLGGTVQAVRKKETIEDITAFLNGTDSEIGGKMQVCAIMDCYLESADDALRVSEIFIRHMNEHDSERGQAKYQYTYMTDEKKGRYVVWGNPKFVGKVLTAADHAVK